MLSRPCLRVPLPTPALIPHHPLILRPWRCFHSMASSITKYDAIVVGSGQAGTPLSSAFAKAGHKTALIERSHIGGSCVNEGCTPTKTLIASGRVAHLLQRGQDFGIHTSELERNLKNEVFVDMEKVRDRKRKIVESFRTGNEKRLIDAGVDVLMGEASFVDEKTLNVKLNDGSEKLVQGGKIYLNTGERPAPPSLEGIEKISSQLVLDSTSIQELDVVPEHLIVIGGGYVGVEFAQLFRRLGARVTIFQRAKQLLPREDPEIAESLLKILEEDGLNIKLESSPTKILPIYNEGLELFFKQNHGEEMSISGSHILFAAGRIPNSDSLNLSTAKILTDAKGYITCNDFLETSIPNVFVMGDLKGPPAFTHISYDDFRVTKANHLSSTKATMKLSIKDRLVPYVVYTDPQLGHIGLHTKESRLLFPNRNIKTASIPMIHVARALETDESRGMMKATVDGDTGEILGFTCLGIEGGELMSVVQMAMIGGVHWQKLRDAVWAHPTLSESLNNLWESME